MRELFKKFTLIMLSCIIMGALVLASPTFVRAVNPVITIDSAGTDAGRIVAVAGVIKRNLGQDVGNSITNFFTVSTSGSTVTVTLDMEAYAKLKQNDKQKVMQIVLSDINNSDISVVNRTKLYNGVAKLDASVSSLVRQLDSDVNADFARGYNWFKPFSGPISTILGFLTLIIFVTLSITIVVDMAYITIPMFQQFLNRDDASKKPKFVSIEAWKAVEAAYKSSGSDYVNPMTHYLGHKTKTFIGLGICILYLVSGQIFTLMASIVDLLQGILE